jgi:hypothetical protein
VFDGVGVIDGVTVFDGVGVIDGVSVLVGVVVGVGVSIVKGLVIVQTVPPGSSNWKRSRRLIAPAVGPFAGTVPSKSVSMVAEVLAPIGCVLKVSVSGLKSFPG